MGMEDCMTAAFNALMRAIISLGTVFIMLPPIITFRIPPQIPTPNMLMVNSIIRGKVLPIHAVPYISTMVTHISKPAAVAICTFEFFASLGASAAPVIILSRYIIISDF